MPLTGNCKIFYILIIFYLISKIKCSLMIRLHSNQSIQFILTELLFGIKTLQFMYVFRSDWALPSVDVQWTLKKQSWCLFTRFYVSCLRRQKIIYWWEAAAEWPCFHAKQVITGPWCDWWLHNIISSSPSQPPDLINTASTITTTTSREQSGKCEASSQHCEASLDISMAISV